MAGIPSMSNFWSWEFGETMKLTYYWLRGDVEGQRRVSYRHHLRHGDAWVNMIDGKEVYGGYYPPESMEGRVMIQN